MKHKDVGTPNLSNSPILKHQTSNTMIASNSSKQHESRSLALTAPTFVCIRRAQLQFVDTDLVQIVARRCTALPIHPTRCSISDWLLAVLGAPNPHPAIVFLDRSDSLASACRACQVPPICCSSAHSNRMTPTRTPSTTCPARLIQEHCCLSVYLQRPLANQQ